MNAMTLLYSSGDHDIFIFITFILPPLIISNLIFSTIFYFSRKRPVIGFWQHFLYSFAPSFMLLLWAFNGDKLGPKGLLTLSIFSNIITSINVFIFHYRRSKKVIITDE